MYQAKEITKKVYDSMINSIKVKCKVGAIFMNSRNSKTSDTYGLLLNLLDEINLRISNKYVA